MRRAGILVTAVLVMLGVASGAADAAPKPHALGVEWGNSHFTEPEQLNTWLADRGVRYDDWLRLHPRGAYLMTHLAPAPAPAGATPIARVQRVGGLSGAAIGVIYGVAALLLLAAAIPSSVLVRVVPMRYGVLLTPARTTFAAAGLSLVVGAIVASLV